MKRKIIELNCNNRKIKINAVIVPFWYEGIGLMFSRKEKARILLFKFKHDVDLAIHSWFVFYSFIAIWLNSKDEIIDIKRVSPFKTNILPKGGKFDRLIEIPINSKNKKLVKLLVD